MGGGKNLAEASAILYKSIKGKTFAFINCCENEFSIASESRPGSNPLSVTQQYRAIQDAKRQADYVIVIVHGGPEGCQYPSPRMQDTYRFFIEVGANVVINHHQHCYSGFEYYQGKPICYGLGDFSFDNVSAGGEANLKKRTSWNEGYMAKLTFDDNEINIKAIPYIQAYKEPGTFMMEGEDLAVFNEQLQSINDVIMVTLKTEEKYNQWTDANSDWHRIMYEPWGKGWRILHKKGLLPSLVSREKWLSLADYTICETHHDRVKRIFKLMIDNFNKK